jgi:hypothetical protein
MKNKPYNRFLMEAGGLRTKYGRTSQRRLLALVPKAYLRLPIYELKPGAMSTRNGMARSNDITDVTRRRISRIGNAVRQRCHDHKFRSHIFKKDYFRV